ncbi:MAG: hypothetical protein ACFFD4_17795 [Candidatus Odinarchaeota archaeon]
MDESRKITGLIPAWPVICPFFPRLSVWWKWNIENFLNMAIMTILSVERPRTPGRRLENGDQRNGN